MRLGLQRQGVVQYLLSVLVLPEAVVNGTHRCQQCRLGCRLILQPGLQAPRARVQQLAGGDLVAAVLFGIRQLEQVDQKARYLASADALLLRALALLCGPVALRRDSHRLDVGRGRKGDDQHEHAHARGDGEPVTAHELRGPIAQGIAARYDGQAVQVALNVSRHVLRGAVATLGLLAHGHGDDVVQIVAQGPRQTADAGASGLRDGQRSGGFGVLHGKTGRERVSFAYRALDVGQARRRNDEGTGSGQQLVEQHAEDVHIARGGDGLAADLLRAGMVRRHHPNVGVGDGQGRLPYLAVVQELRNPKIEQLRRARCRHQDVRGFEIPMHDEVLVRVMHGGAHGLKQVEPSRDSQTVRVAIDIDGDAIDIFHDQVGRPVRQSAAVQ